MKLNREQVTTSPHTNLLSFCDILFVSWRPNHWVYRERAAQVMVIVCANFVQKSINSRTALSRPFCFLYWALIWIGNEEVIAMDKHDDVFKPPRRCQNFHGVDDGGVLLEAVARRAKGWTPSANLSARKDRW